MPSPIAHSVTGYAISKFFPLWGKVIPGSGKSIIPVFFIIFVANAADLDFIPQLLTGQNYHHGLTHSLTFALCFSGIMGLISYFFCKPLYMRLFWLTFAVYNSHLFLDCLTIGSRGIKILWPFKESLFSLPISIFPGVHYSQGLLHCSHFIFIGFELAYSALLFWSLWKWKVYL